MRTAVIAVCMAMLLTGPAHAGKRDSEVCDIQKAPCVSVTDSGLEVAFSVTPRPVKTMQNLEFIVTLKKNGKPVTGALLLLDLSMPGMFMGNNQPKLREEQSGRYRGSGIIPRCVTGQRIWKAFIAIRHNGKVEKVSFLVEVQ